MSVASISNGTLEALSPGNTTITCTAANGVSAQCYVTVNPIYVSSISLNKSEIDIVEGEQFTLIATISPTNATNKAIGWSSTSNSIAIVGNNGVVIGLSEGYCYITASAKDGSGINNDCLVHVKKKSILAESIALTPTSATLKVGQTTALTATVLPQYVTDGSLAWTSSDISVATVNEEGLVSAISVGNVTITATTTDGTNLSASCNVEVVKYPLIATDANDNPVNVAVKSGDAATIYDTYKSIEITDDVKNVDITYSRKFTNTKWQSLYVPFDIVLTQDILDHFDFAKFAGAYSDEDDGLSFLLRITHINKVGDVINANTPYFIKAKASSSAEQTITAYSTTLYKTALCDYRIQAAEKNIDMAGVYTKKSITESDHDWYYFSNGTYTYAGKYVGYSLGAFRYTISITGRDDNPYTNTHGASVKLILVDDEEDATDINDVNSHLSSLNSRLSTTYNLAGQPVGSDYKGIVIKNGKKYMQ